MPGRDFAVIVVSNAGPDAGLAFNQAVVRFALERYLGVTDQEHQPLPYDQARAAEITGIFENDFMTLTIEDDGTSLSLTVLIKAEIRAASDTELPPDLPAASVGLLPGGTDEYIVTSGGLNGQRGFFTRDGNGAVIGADLAGRLFNRVR